MLILGLTGSLATGKSTVAGMFAKRGAYVLDADKIAHALLAPGGRCFPRIVRDFGKEILVQGKVDRKKLSDIVFRDPRRLKELTRILHPEVIREIKRTIAREGRKKKDKILVIDAPLLLEAGIHPFTDILIVVKANRQKQLARVKRKRVSNAEALRRIKTQMPINVKIKMADIVIDNRGHLNQTRKQVEEIWRRLILKKQKT